MRYNNAFCSKGVQVYHPFSELKSDLSSTKQLYKERLRDKLSS